MIRESQMPGTQVPSGSYIISRKKGEMLDAYLGSCIGVTICDPHVGVGGLIHILLPEPPGGLVLGNPKTYALTALPLFIKELYDQGAIKENLTAVMAGGALVGPLSKLDLNLDIGGRNAEVVERILDKEGIPIHRRETGGFFSCRLSLSLTTWESDIRPITSPALKEDADFTMPTSEELDLAMANVQPIPQIVLKIIRMLQDNTCGMQEIGREIRQDQVISGKVIRLCNSAFFRQKMGIDSIDRALIVLGEKRILKLIVSASMQEYFSKEAGGYSLCKGGLFNHAVGTAIISEKLTNFIPEISGDIAYTAGLLHDIGKVVLDQYMDLTYSLFYRRTQEGGENLINVEHEVFGANHPEIGGRLAVQWSLPESLVEVIRYHHNPEKASINPELSHIVYFADLLMSRFIVGQELERLNTDSLVTRLERIGLKPEQFPDIVESISNELFNLSSSGEELF